MSWAYALLFLAFFVTLNYTLNFENEYLDIHIGTWQGILFNFMFFAIAYYGMVFLIAAIKGNVKQINTTPFWLRSFSILLVIGFFNGYYLFPDFVNSQNDYSNYVFLFYLSNALKAWVFYFVPILLMHRFLEKSSDTIYGFTFKGINILPYCYLLVAALPFLVLASYQPAFQIQYPFFKPWVYTTVFGSDSSSYAFIFELAYGSNFVFLEWVFRGVLVIGMARVIGKEALLPMVSVYAFLHFGKPLAETIAAIFGGYLLGILAYQSKSIIGGCFIHVGVAWMMDLAAYMQHFFSVKP